MTWYTRGLTVLVWAVLGAGTLRAADQVILGSKILIKDPTTVEEMRQVKGAGKESGTSLPITLVQPSGAATLTVVTAGTTPGTQTFELTGTWVAAGSVGWKYKAGGTSPVKSILLKRTASGTAQLKVLIKGNVGTDLLTLAPPNTGTKAGVILDDSNGTRYCVRLGVPAGGVAKKNDATQFFLVASSITPAIDAGCPTTTTTAIPTTTSSSSTSSSTSSTSSSTSYTAVQKPADLVSWHLVGGRSLRPK